MKYNYINHIFPLLMVVICISTVVPASAATESPTVDVEISRAKIDSVYLNITINNPNQIDGSVTSLDYTISEPIGASGFIGWEAPFGQPPLLKANESFTYSTRHSIISGDPLKRFYQRGSMNITASGSISIDVGSNSFEVPFHNSTTIFLETGEVNQTISPNISDINFNTNKLTDENGIIREIITITNISIYNPNSVALSMHELYCEVSVKKNESTRQLNNIYSGFHSSNQIINPMDTYVHSIESRITDNDTIQYFINEEPKYIKVKGDAFLISNETGWSPAYFEPRFNTIITINGTGADEEVVPDTEQSSIPGFEVIYAIAGLLAITCLLRKRG